jgi:DNA adenine methylase
MRFVTPLRYPGGKAKLWKYIASVIRANNCLDGHYAEPYAGGAGIALQLLHHELVRFVHLNDLNKSVYSFWYSVLNDTDKFCEKISKCKLTIPEWRKQRAIQKYPSNHDTLELGFSLFYLNRTNRSGIINGGVIGGTNQKGPWKIDARFNKKDLIERIQTIAEYKHRIQLSNLDAEKFLKKKAIDLPENSLIYLDPPYYEKGHRLYDNFYVHSDHARLEKFLSKEMKHKKWLVSYDNVSSIKQLYKKYRQQIYGLSYSANDYRVGAEIIIFSPKISLEKVTVDLRLAA